MKRKLYLILLVLIVLLYACGDSSVQDNADNTNVPDDSESVVDFQEDITRDPAYEYDGEQIDFNGATFTVLYPLWSLYVDYYFAEEATGDAVNDALYRRQLKRRRIF